MHVMDMVWRRTCLAGMHVLPCRARRRGRGRGRGCGGGAAAAREGVGGRAEAGGDGGADVGVVEGAVARHGHERLALLLVVLAEQPQALAVLLEVQPLRLRSPACNAWSLRATLIAQGYVASPPSHFLHRSRQSALVPPATRS